MKISKHKDVGDELTKTEFHDEEAHELLTGTSFPGSPSEGDIFYRTDLHRPYIYDATDWVRYARPPVLSPNYYMYWDPDASTYRAKEGLTDTILVSNSNPATVVSAMLTALRDAGKGGVIVMRGGHEYAFNANNLTIDDFDGITDPEKGITFICHGHLKFTTGSVIIGPTKEVANSDLYFQNVIGTGKAADGIVVNSAGSNHIRVKTVIGCRYGVYVHPLSTATSPYVSLNRIEASLLAGNVKGFYMKSTTDPETGAEGNTITWEYNVENDEHSVLIEGDKSDFNLFIGQTESVGGLPSLVDEGANNMFLCGYVGPLNTIELGSQSSLISGRTLKLGGQANPAKNFYMPMAYRMGYNEFCCFDDPYFVSYIKSGSNHAASMVSIENTFGGEWYGNTAAYEWVSKMSAPGGGTPTACWGFELYHGTPSLGVIYFVYNHASESYQTRTAYGDMTTWTSTDPPSWPEGSTPWTSDTKFRIERVPGHVHFYINDNWVRTHHTNIVPAATKLGFFIEVVSGTNSVSEYVYLKNESFQRVPIIGPIVYEAYDSGGGDTAGCLGSVWKAQTFTVGSSSHKVSMVSLRLMRENNPGTLTVSIRATDEDGKPTGGDLTSGTLNASLVTDNVGGYWYDIPVSEITLSANIKYAVVCRVSSGSYNLYMYGEAHSPTYEGGCRADSANAGSSWTLVETFDFDFHIWGAA